MLKAIEQAMRQELMLRWTGANLTTEEMKAEAKAMADSLMPLHKASLISMMVAKASERSDLPEAMFLCQKQD
jgi:hypothetical protein